MAVLLAIFGNLWIYKIAQLSLVYFLVVAGTSFAFAKHTRFFTITTFVLLVSIQIINFEPINLTELSNDEVRVRDERLSIYPTELLQIGYYLDAKPEVLVTRKIINGVIRQFDPNIYFFAGHPRERIGVAEFEKFPYILLPVFLVGVYKALKGRKLILALFIIPTIINAFNKNSHLDFALLPFFSTTIYLGLVQSIKLAEKFKYKNYLYFLFAIIYLLVMIQIISYEIS